MSVTFHFIFLNKTCYKNIIQINLWHLLEYFIHVHALLGEAVKAAVNDRVLSQTQFHGTFAQFFIP